MPAAAHRRPDSTAVARGIDVVEHIVVIGFCHIEVRPVAGQPSGKVVGRAVDGQNIPAVSQFGPPHDLRKERVVV